MSDFDEGKIDLFDSDRNFVDELVRSGQFGSLREVVSAGLSALRERQVEVERWIITEIEAASDAMDSEPSLEVPAEQVFAELRERHRERFKTG